MKRARRIITVLLRYYKRTVGGVQETKSELTFDASTVGSFYLQELKQACYKQLGVKVKVERKWRNTDVREFMEGKETLARAVQTWGPNPTVIFYIGNKTTYKNRNFAARVANACVSTKKAPLSGR